MKISGKQLLAPFFTNFHNCIALAFTNNGEKNSNLFSSCFLTRPPICSWFQALITMKDQSQPYGNGENKGCNYEKDLTAKATRVEVHCDGPPSLPCHPFTWNRHFSSCFPQYKAFEIDILFLHGWKANSRDQVAPGLRWLNTLRSLDNLPLAYLVIKNAFILTIDKKEKCPSFVCHCPENR